MDAQQVRAQSTANSNVWHQSRYIVSSIVCVFRKDKPPKGSHVEPKGSGLKPLDVVNQPGRDSSDGSSTKIRAVVPGNAAGLPQRSPAAELQPWELHTNCTFNTAACTSTVFKQAVPSSHASGSTSCTSSRPTHPSSVCSPVLSLIHISEPTRPY